MGNALDAELAHGEACFVDAGGLGSGAQDIGFIRSVIGGRYSLGFLKETGRMSHGRRQESEQGTYYGAESMR